MGSPMLQRREREREREYINNPLERRSLDLLVFFGASPLRTVAILISPMLKHRATHKTSVPDVILSVS
jgi:hypothetical protein